VAESFQDSFCGHFQVPPERYTQEILRRTLTPAARWLSPFLLLADRDYFSADRDFVHGVGALTRQGDFHAEAQDFRYHPGNRRFLRRALRLRVSAYRLRCVVAEVWPNFVSRRSVSRRSSTPLPAADPPAPPSAGATSG